MKNSVAMVTGAGGPAGRAVSQYFQQNGVAVLRADMNLVDSAPNFTQIPPASDKEFVGAIDQLLDEAEIGLLVPTVTEELPKIAAHREPIWQKDCALFVSSMESVRIANDKWETVRLLSDRSIAVPSSYCGISKEELLKEVSFPMLSKPRRGRGGRGIGLYRCSEDLPVLLSTDRIYQEFLPADEYDVNLFAEPGGRSVVTVVLKKTALKNGLVGNALSVERVIEPDVAELAEAAVRTLSLEGPIDIDIRRGIDAASCCFDCSNCVAGTN